MKRNGDRDAEIAWTAARCNRLLRTITSRLGVLRKLSKHTSQAEISSEYVAGQVGDLPNTAPEKVQPLREFQANTPLNASPQTTDPDWLPQARKRQCCRTYAVTSKRRKLKADKENVQIADDFRTPFIKRVLVPTSEEDAAQSLTPLDFEKSKHNQHGRKRRALPTLPATPADQAYRALLEAFEALLVATKPETPPTRLGTSSLLKACLRKVPAYIDLEYSFAKDEREAGNHDIITQTYEYLEGFGSRPGGGWRGLRSVVRAHAVFLVQGAMSDGILADDALEALLSICRRREAIQESQQILRAWFENSSVPTKTRLERLVGHCVAFGYRSLLLHICTDAVNRDPTTLESFCERSLFWREVVKAFTSPSTKAVASSFCEAFAACCTHHSLQTEQSPSTTGGGRGHDAIAVLTALAWTQSRTGSAYGIAPQLTRIPSIMNIFAKDASAGGIYFRLCRNDRIGQLIQSFFLSDLTVRLVEFPEAPDILSLDEREILDCIGGLDDSDKLRETAANFVCSVGKIVAYTEHADEHGFVKSAVNGMLQAAERNLPGHVAALRGIATSTARMWADQRDDDQSYSLLEDVEHAVWTSESYDATSSPVNSRRPTSYRWEEGLCEWVARTPCAGYPGDLLRDHDTSTGLHDSGVELDDTPPADKRPPQLTSMAMALCDSANDFDDEDELALITPVHQKRNLRQVRFDCRQHSAIFLGNVRKTLMPGGSGIMVDDESDDELA